MSKQVRVRFAPSPTGYLHVGGARTALFNWLFARNQGGTFILRIEDTDRTRYNEQALVDLKRDLKWLGMDWDEGPEKGGDFGPYVQSERLDLYKKHADELVAADKAYHCFCSSERLESLRESQKEENGATGYDRHCRNLDKGEVETRLAKGESSVIRLKVPLQGEISFKDFLRGNITTKNSILDDMVILKADGFPTYHLASVIDDHFMQITHVLRGDEWIPSTSKHLTLYNAFGWEPPVFVHLPVILSATGGKLSKRKGAASVGDFRDKGILEESLFNFLALLGWSPGGDKEKMSIEEMASLFTLERINTTSAVFNEEKLDWLNSQYFIQGEASRFLSSFKEILGDKAGEFEDEQLLKIIDFIKERVKFLQDFSPESEIFLSGPQEIEGKTAKQLKKDGWQDTLTKIGQALAKVEDFKEASIEQAFQDLMETEGGGFGQWVKPARIALTGQLSGPSVYGIVEVLGKTETLARLQYAVENF